MPALPARIPVKVLGSIAFLALAAHAAPLKVFILAGQSNMVGLGKVAQMGSSPKSFPNIRLYKALDGAPAVSFYPGLAAGQTGVLPEQFGPEFGIAEQLTAKFPNEKLVFIKVAYGATSLQGNWINDEPGPNGGTGVYTWFQSRVTQSLQALKASPDGGSLGIEIWGVFWMQGESDAVSPQYSARGIYSANLKKLVDEKFRVLLAAYPNKRVGGKLPFVYGQIRIHGQDASGIPFPRVWPYGEQIVEEQYRAQYLIQGSRCTSGPAGAEIYLNAPPAEANAGYGAPHYNAAGLRKVGTSLGAAMVERLSGRLDLGCPAPETAATLMDLID